MNLFHIFTRSFLLFQMTKNTYCSSLNTVAIEPEYYKGIWYQTYGDKFVLDTFEKNAYCAGANYTILSDKKIGVYNWERYGSIDGPTQNISGYAVITDEPGQLVVHLNGNYPAPYWVIKIGPNINSEYQYSVVSDPYMFGLFILCRNVTEYYELYNDEVLQFLNDTGFTSTFNKPIQMVQENCNYSFI
jgi:lipocalin